MFTGIIQTTGEVVGQDATATGVSLRIRSDLFKSAQPAVRIGDSIAVSGVCLTVTELKDDIARFDLATETQRKTNLGDRKTGSPVNLERSLRLGDPLDGHLVQGHVDCTSAVLNVQHEANTVRIEMELPQPVRGLIVQKGSVTLDGVSLTVGECLKDRFCVYIIPHTLKVTTLTHAAAGVKLNLEADCVSRYLRGIAAAYLPMGGGQ